MACPVCGRKFDLAQIKVRGSIDPVMIVQTTCSEGHLTLFMTVFTKTKKEAQPAIVNDEVLDLSNNLKKFNGDFQSLWPR